MGDYDITSRKKRYRVIIGLILLTVLLAGFLIPERPVIPVMGADRNDWHPNTFWYEPWGTSGVHKGMDIFAPKDTHVLASTGMLRLYAGHIAKGGLVVLALGPGWKLHYFAHLSSIEDTGMFLSAGDVLGGVGDTGNAMGKQPHLHYAIVSLLPRPWLIDGSTQGYKKMFYLDPIEYLSD